MLEIITPPTSRSLATIEAVKKELNITDASQDAFLQTLIDQASDMIETFCNRTFARAGYRETLPGYGMTRLVLSQTPIVEVTSIMMNNDIITDFVVENAQAGILYRQRGWKWTPVLGWNINPFPIPNSEALLFTIDYTAGYALPEDVGRNLPHDIEKACIEIVKAWYESRDRNPAISSERIGDYQVSYAIQEIPTAVTQMLVPWRRFI